MGETILPEKENLRRAVRPWAGNEGSNPPPTLTLPLKGGGNRKGESPKLSRLDPQAFRCRSTA